MKFEMKADKLALSCCVIALVFILLAMLGWLSVKMAVSLCGIAMTLYFFILKMRRG